MSDNQITADQFKVNHYRQMLAELTVQHADSSANMAIRLQMVTQERDEALVRVQSLEEELQELKGSEAPDESVPEE